MRPKITPPKALFSLLLVCVMFSSCNEEKTVEFERVQLDERVLKEATPMKAETLWTSDELPLAAKECLVYKG